MPPTLAGQPRSHEASPACVRGLYAAAAHIPRHPRSRGPSTWPGEDDEPRRRDWEKTPRRGRRPSCCFVLFRFCDPDLVCSQRGEKTLGSRVLKLKGGPRSQLLKRKGTGRTFSRLFCASRPGRSLPREGRTQACAGLGRRPREKARSQTRVSDGPSPCCGPHLPSWVRILLLETLKDSLAASATGAMAPEEPQGLACPGRAAVSALLPGPEARARRLSGTCLLWHFFSWQEADRKVPPFLPELPCLGFVPLGAGARKARGERRVHEMGSSEGPQSTSRAAGCSDPCPTDPEAEQR